MLNTKNMKISFFEILVVCCGIAGLAQITLIIRSQIMESRSRELQESLNRSAVIMKENLAKYDYALQGVAGLYAVEDFKPTDVNFRKYAQSRDFFKDLNGTIGVGFARPVPGSEGLSYQKKLLQKKSPHSIRRLDGQKISFLSHLFVVEKIEPQENNRDWPGLDLASEKEIFTAATQARISGLPSMTSQIPLYPFEKKRQGFILFHPLYRNSTTASSSQIQTREFIGWVFGVYDSHQLFAPVYSQADHRLQLQIDNQKDIPIPAQISTASRKAPKAAYLDSLSVRIFNQEWKVNAQADDYIWTTTDSWLLWSFSAIAFLALLPLAAYMQSMAQAADLASSKSHSLSSWQNAVLQSTDYAIITTNPKGLIESINPAAEKMLGYSSQEVLGLKTLETFCDFSEELHQHVLFSKTPHRRQSRNLKEMESGALISGSQTIRCYHTRRDGMRIPVQLTLTPIRGPEDLVVGFLAISRDITEVIRAESQLKQVIDALNASAIVATTDVRGKIIEVNETFCKITGYNRDELIGQSHRIINSGYHESDFFKKMWQQIQSGKVWTGEIQNRKKSGELYWVHTVISPLYDEFGKMDRFLAIRFDITERKKSELSVIQSARMASLGEMAGGIAHEINNPLAVIRSRSDLLLRSSLQGNLDPIKLQTDLKKIASTSDRIAKIILGLRTFSRDSSAEKSQVSNLQSILDESVDLCQQTFKNKGISLKIQNHIEKPVLCRPLQMSQVLVNLLNNSMDAISGLNEKWIEIETSDQGEQVVIRVTDSGNGIPKEIVHKIMQPFFTTKEVGKGTGMGLSISKGMIEGQGGKFYYDPTSPHTRFVIEIPKAEMSVVQQVS